MTEERTRGIVLDAEPNHLYKVRLANGRLILAHLGGLASLKIVRVVPGDHVTVRVSEMDPHRGSIVGRVIDDREQRP